MNRAANVLHYPSENALKRGHNVVLVGGCFDVLHYGHLQFLKAAKNEGDTLIVALESDEFIRERKHRKPVHSHEQRAEMLASLDSVDLVLLLPYLTTDAEYAQLVKTVAPNVIAVTEGDSQIEHKKEYARAVGARLAIVTPVVQDLSTTNILNYQSKSSL